ncbi:MAG: nitroreductase family protein [Flavobacteriales bacterium]
MRIEIFVRDPNNIKMKEEHRHIRYEREVVNPKEMLARAGAFYKKMQGRRSVRFFSKRPIPKEVILRVIAAAGTAPSGANKQPWAFCAISSNIEQGMSNVEVKKKSGRTTVSE